MLNYQRLHRKYRDDSTCPAMSAASILTYDELLLRCDNNGDDDDDDHHDDCGLIISTCPAESAAGIDQLQQ